MALRKVTIQQGDTLWKIAERELGDPQRWREVFHWNVVPLMERGRVPERVGPNYIWPGTELVIVTDVEFEPSGN